MGGWLRLTWGPVMCFLRMLHQDICGGMKYERAMMCTDCIRVMTGVREPCNIDQRFTKIMCNHVHSVFIVVRWMPLCDAGCQWQSGTHITIKYSHLQCILED